MVVKVAVIGGGIAGLSALHKLQSAKESPGIPLELILFERQNRLGGKILTERVDGFVVEGGPDTFVSTKPWGVKLCAELGIQDRLQGTDMERRRVYVLHRGRLVEMPEGLAMMVPTQIRSMLKTPLISPLGKLRMGLDLILPPRKEGSDESLGHFVSRRLGREAYQHLIEPLMSGIYAGDGDRLSLQSTFPFLHDWEQQYGSVTCGALKLRRKRSKAHSAKNGRNSIFLSPRAGLAELVQAITEQLDDVSLRLGTRISTVIREGSGWVLNDDRGGRTRVDAVILAAPAYAAAVMLQDLAPELSALLLGIEYVSTATVSLAYREEELGHPLAGHGYVIPRVEQREALACTWTSSKFPHRAPSGAALLRVFIGRAGRTQSLVSDENRLREIAVKEVADTLAIRTEPIFTRVHRWPNAMPQYNLGHPARLQAIQSQIDLQPGIYLAGAAYEGIGIPDCIHSGQRAAEEVIDYFENEAN
jgi:oxygen-dependent protoporphyrinogen oxidase